MKGVRLGRTCGKCEASTFRRPTAWRHEEENNYFGVCCSLVYLCAITFGSRKDVHTVLIISGNRKLAFQLIACLNSGQWKKLVLVKGCGKCFYKEAACFFCPVLREKRRTPEVKHCRKREMCSSCVVALLVKVSVEWIASVQEITHNSRYSVGTVHVIMLWRENRRVRRLWRFVFQFGREKGEHENTRDWLRSARDHVKEKEGSWDARLPLDNRFSFSFVLQVSERCNQWAAQNCK